MKKNKMLAGLAAVMISTAMVLPTVTVSPIVAMAENPYPGYTLLYKGDAGTDRWGGEILAGEIWYRFDEATGTLTLTGEGATGTDEMDELPSEYDVRKVCIEGNITAIANYSFFGLDNLEEVVITAPVVTIQDGGFSGLHELVKVELPSTVKTIGNNAFDMNEKLESINLPIGLTSLGSSVFLECSSLNYVWIPDTVTSLGDHVFYACTNLKSVRLPEGIEKIGDDMFTKTALSDFQIPETVTEICDVAFADCTSLTTIDIPANVTKIGNWAFGGSTNLTSMKMWSEVPAEIGSSVFTDTGKNSIMDIYVPKGSKDAYKAAWGTARDGVKLNFVEYDGWTPNLDLNKEYMDTYTGKKLTTRKFTDSIPIVVEALTEGAPAFDTIAPMKIDATTSSTTISLPSTAATSGDFWYTLKEAEGATAGVTYATDTTYYLHLVTRDLKGKFRVVQAKLHTSAPKEDGTFEDDDKKINLLTNQYADGSLTIQKKVQGNYLANTENDRYTVVVTLTAPEGKTVRTTISYNDGTAKTITGGWTGSRQILLTMKKDATVTFNNIPDGMTYTITENELVDYDLPKFAFDVTNEAGDVANTGDTWADCSATGTISDAADIVTITNTKNMTVDVGVLLENAPYLMLLAGAAVAGVLVFTRRKRTYEE